MLRWIIALTMMQLVIIGCHGKGLNKSWTTYRDNKSYCGGTIVVIEDGYKLLKLVPKKNQLSNQKVEKIGIWGFKVKFKIISNAGFKDYLKKRYLRAHEMLTSKLSHVEESNEDKKSLIDILRSREKDQILSEIEYLA